MAYDFSSIKMLGQSQNEFNVNYNRMNTLPSNPTGVSPSKIPSAKAAKVMGITSSLISGLGDIATGFINAGMIRETAQFNAELALLQGRMRRVSATVEIRNIRKKADIIYGQQRAAYAKAGVKLTGTPAEVMKRSLQEAELDAIYSDISADYDIGLKKSEADLYRARGEQAKYGAYFKTAKTLLNLSTQYLVNK